MKIFYNTMVNWPNWKEHTKSRRSGQFESGDIAKSVKRIVDEVNKFSRYASRTKALEISVWTNKTNKDGSFSGGYDNGQAPEVVVKFDLDGTESGNMGRRFRPSARRRNSGDPRSERECPARSVAPGDASLASPF